MQDILSKSLMPTLLTVEMHVLDELIRYSSQPHPKQTALQISPDDAPGIVDKDHRIHDAILELLPDLGRKAKVFRVLEELRTQDVFALNIALLLGQSIKSVRGYGVIHSLCGDDGEISSEYAPLVLVRLNQKVMQYGK